MNAQVITSLTLLAVASCLGCARPVVDARASGAGGTTTQRQAIVEGEVATEHPAVVGVSVAGSRCSANLVAPTVVLTAQHCIGDAGTRYAVEELFVTTGISQITPERTVAVREVRLPRGRRFTDEQRSPIYGGADFAVLLLAESIDDIAPLKLRRAPLDELGTTATMVGFGNRDDGGSGERRVREATVVDVTGLTITTEARACSGDSGGPLLDSAGRVAGVLSTGPKDVCSNEDGVYNAYGAIARMPGFVDEALRDEGACDVDAVEVCDGYDNDCDEDVDEGCAQPGETCAADEDCADLRACVDGICAVPCAPDGIVDAFDVELSCPAGLVCARAESNCFVGVCTRPGDGAEGAACVEDTECASQHCAVDADGASRCRAPCVGADGLCKEGLVCAVDADGCGSCVDDDPLSPPAEGCASTPAPLLFALAALLRARRRRQRGSARHALAASLALVLTVGVSACGAEPPVFDDLTPYDRPALTRRDVECPVNGELRTFTVPFVDELEQAVLQPFPVERNTRLFGFGTLAVELAGDAESEQVAGDACGCVDTELVVMAGTLAEGERIPASPRVLEIIPYSAAESCSPVWALETTLEKPIALEAGETLFVGARYAVTDDGAEMTCFQACNVALSPTGTRNVEMPADGPITLAYESDLYLDAWIIVGE